MFDIIFCFIVMYGHSLNYISVAINMWCLIYLVCTYSEDSSSSRGELTGVIKYAAVCRIAGLASFCPRELTLPSLTREV